MATKAVAKRRRARPKMTIPLAPVISLIFPAQKAYHVYTETGSIESGIRNWFAYYTGWTGNPGSGPYEPAYLKYGLFPLAIGLAAHAIAGKLGINRTIARAHIPYVRI